jgi:hypothetical protein
LTIATQQLKSHSGHRANWKKPRKFKRFENGVDVAFGAASGGVELRNVCHGVATHQMASQIQRITL